VREHNTSRRDSRSRSSTPADGRLTRVSMVRLLHPDDMAAQDNPAGFEADLRQAVLSKPCAGPAGLLHFASGGRHQRTEQEPNQYPRTHEVQHTTPHVATGQVSSPGMAAPRHPALPRCCCQRVIAEKAPTMQDLLAMGPAHEPRTTSLVSDLRRYFLSLAGAAAAHAPFLSAPPFGSHFIFAFTQSALVVGVACANADGASTSAPITTTTERSFIFPTPRVGPPNIVSIGHLAE